MEGQRSRICAWLRNADDRCWPNGAGRECYRYLDALNTRHGRRSIQLASAGVGGADRKWTMKQELKTPTTRRPGRICRGRAPEQIQLWLAAALSARSTTAT
ncbi:MAG: DUF4113 domain-containing protein [Comamonadaceae bacterium]|nr:MAG: DUF4113 domain-containing protein [Comamonadaceae bacterium]